MKKLRDKLSEPLNLAIIIFVAMIIGFFAVMAADGATGFEITVQNTTDKVAYVKIMGIGDSPPEYKIEPNSSRNIPMSYGAYFVCIGFERDVHGSKIVDVWKCTYTEITEENLYDEDGNKQYWEISE